MLGVCVENLSSVLRVLVLLFPFKMGWPFCMSSFLPFRSEGGFSVETEGQAVPRAGEVSLVMLLGLG